MRHIVEAHGGRIWGESDGVGKGCTFFFSLDSPGRSHRDGRTYFDHRSLSLSPQQDQVQTLDKTSLADEALQVMFYLLRISALITAVDLREGAVEINTVVARQDGTCDNWIRVAAENGEFHKRYG